MNNSVTIKTGDENEKYESVLHRKPRTISDDAPHKKSNR